MPSFKEKYGPWAVVAGAAEGLGEAYSVSLAKKGLNLVMIDNQRETLQKLASELEKEYSIQIVTLHLDLGEKDAVKQIMAAIGQKDVRLLVYNAAFSMIKPFTDLSEEELDKFIEINSRTQIRLVHAFSKKLIAGKRPGGILLMSSLAGLIGMQLVTPYSASKAFTWNLAEALHHELKPHSIDVMACIAGATATPAYLKTNPKYGKLKPLVMKSAEVADAALNKLGKRTLFIPGFSNRLNYFILTRLIPRKAAANMVNKMMGKMYLHHL